MREIIAHAVRRGVQQSIVRINGEDIDMPEIPAWGLTLFYISILAFGVFFAGVQYTINDVVGTLTMIETPSTETALSLSDEDPDRKKGVRFEPETIAIKPITSKIRTTVRHITAIGGRWARWRGVVPAFMYCMLTGITSGFFEVIVPRLVPGRTMIAKTMAAVLLSQVHMAWTHALISMPSTLRWYQRLAPMKSVKQLWVPNAVKVVASYVVIYLTMGLIVVFGACNQSMIGEKQPNEIPAYMWAVLALQGVTIIIFPIAMSLFVVLPATVTLARVEASLLPEDQETIVPFDRSFDGKVVPRILGGTGAIGFVDAWRTFNWEARRRLLKLYLKSFLITIALVILFSQVLSFEAWAVMGPQLGKLLAALKEAASHQ